jgi:hypothetical protein
MTASFLRGRSALGTLTLILCASAALTGCKSGGGGSSESSALASTPTTPVTGPSNPSGSNNAPKISGTATASTSVSAAYAFAPTASDADGDTLSFQIQNKPSWAIFNTTNGQLSGTPTAAGTFANIVISATDGKSSAALPAFTITVNAPTATTPTAMLSWVSPTQNTDGSALSDLEGFVIAYGHTSSALSESVKITNPSVDSYVFDQLPAGTYFFAVKAYTKSGVESDLSQVVSKVIS